MKFLSSNSPNMWKTMMFVSVIAFASGIAYTQSLTPSAMNSAGETFSSNTAQLSWSMGGLIAHTFVTNDHILTQGFQQYYDDTEDPNVDVTDPEVEDQNVTVHTDPETGKLSIRSDAYNSGNYTINIYSILGKKVWHQRHTDLNTDVSLQQLPKGIYILEILDEDRSLIKSQKINR